MFRLLETGDGNGPKFSGKDSHSRYLISLGSQPKDWIWRNRLVNYTLNSQQYRCPEWDQCDWQNSILIFGCSMVYGVGVDDSDTLSFHISKSLNLPVINLGQGGTGLGFAWTNSIILNEHNIRPRAVVYIWPDRSRQTEFLSEHSTVSHGSWNIENSWMMPLAIHDTHNYYWSQYTIRGIRQLWDCPVIEASWYADIAGLSGSLCLPPILDYARDLAHPGLETLKMSSNIISSKLAQVIR